MPHKYNSYIELLSEKADVWRNFCICVSCRDTIGRPAALLNKFVNKNERIRTHLKKCEHFKKMYPEKFVEFFELEIENENLKKKRLRDNSVSASTSQTSMYLKKKQFNKIYKISKYLNINTIIILYR